MTGRLHMEGDTILYGGLSGLAATLYTLAVALLVAFATQTLQSNPIITASAPPNFIPLWGLIALYLALGSFFGAIFAAAYHYWPTRTAIMKALVLVLIIGTLIIVAQRAVYQADVTVVELEYLYYLIYAVGLGWIYSRTRTHPG